MIEQPANKLAIGYEYITRRRVMLAKEETYVGPGHGSCISSGPRPGPRVFSSPRHGLVALGSVLLVTIYSPSLTRRYMTTIRRDTHQSAYTQTS
jgi:hypothetical protein